LGSSKTRTKEQEIKGRDLILQKITETTESTAIAFTDGSCLNNPGPCGAGAIVFVEEETTELKQPVCKRGSILLGELSNQNSIRIYRSTRNKKKNRTTYNIFGQSNSNWNT
jgi:hypothetical protein